MNKRETNWFYNNILEIVDIFPSLVKTQLVIIYGGETWIYLDEQNEADNKKDYEFLCDLLAKLISVISKTLS